MALPQFQDGPLAIGLMQNRWAAILDPIIANPESSSALLKNIKLVAGPNNVNHLLSRTLQGWSVVRIDAASTIYDNQGSNRTPTQTLLLIASAPCTVTLSVF